MVKNKIKKLPKQKTSKRYFIGVPVTGELAENILSWRDDKKKDLADVRFINRYTLHLTLVPPFYSRNLKKVEKKIKKALNGHKSFEVSFKEIDFGPQRGKKRLVWITDGDNPLWKKLSNDLLKEFGKKNNKKNWPHVTIARFRARNLEKLPEDILPEKVDWKFNIEEVVFYESTLTPSGAVYEKKALFRLS